MFSSVTGRAKRHAIVDGVSKVWVSVPVESMVGMQKAVRTASSTGVAIAGENRCSPTLIGPFATLLAGEGGWVGPRCRVATRGRTEAHCVTPALFEAFAAVIAGKNWGRSQAYTAIRRTRNPLSWRGAEVRSTHRAGLSPTPFAVAIARTRDLKLAAARPARSPQGIRLSHKVSVPRIERMAGMGLDPTLG